MKIRILIAILSIGLYTQGQVWPVIYGNPYDNYLVSDIEEAYDHGYYIVGRTQDSGSEQDAFILKTDVNGSILWEKRLTDYGYYHYLSKSLITSDQGLIVCGSMNKHDPDLLGDPLFLKINSCGEVDWCLVLESPGDNTGTGIIELADGSYIGMLKYYGGNYSEIRISLVKIDTEGEPVWIKHLAQDDPGIFNEEGYFLDLLPDSNYLVSGRCFCNGEKPFFIKTDTSGEQISDLRWPQGSGVAHETIIFDSTILYSTSGLSMPGNPRRPTLLKFNSEGTYIDQYPLIGDTIEAGGSRPLCNNGDSTLLVGIQWTMDPNYDEGFSEVLKIDTTGNILNRKLLLDYNRPPYKIIKTHDNKILVAGSYYMGGNWDIYFWKMNQDLVFDSLYTQQLSYDSLCNYQIQSDTLDLNCNLFVDINEIPMKNIYEKTIRVSPNPSSDWVTLTFPENVAKGKLRLSIYGPMVNQVTTQELNVSDRDIRLEISHFTPGIYIIISMDSQQQLFTGKIMVIE